MDVFRQNLYESENKGKKGHVIIKYVWLCAWAISTDKEYTPFAHTFNTIVFHKLTSGFDSNAVQVVIFLCLQRNFDRILYEIVELFARVAPNDVEKLTVYRMTIEKPYAGFSE